ncbi:hypothetical protein [Rhodococcus qingshengii]|uniref:hypothetical protein n=1 Tax=Rhodococcus qingshengii TaxID=334542 RepID=UPI000ACE7E0A|nr:hypothetical protein [Rhodococcus qingshengii]
MTDNEVDLDSLEQRRGGRHMVGLEQPQSLEKRSISYLSVRRPITGSIHLQRIWSERDVSVDNAATAVRSMIAVIDVDPESEEFLCALDRLWEQMLSERAAEIVGLRREQTWSADEPGWEGNSSLDYYPRRDVWRTTVHTGRVAGGEEVKIPLALLAPVLIGLIPVFAGVTAPANPFVAILVCIGLVAGMEAVGLWWWTRHDPLRLSAEDKSEIGVAVAAVQSLISAGGAHVELRLALAASALVDEIRTVPVWESEDLDVSRIRLNLDEQLAGILAHAGELAAVRATLGTPTAGGGPQARAAREAHLVSSRWLERVERSLLTRVAALWSYRRHLLALQESITAGESLDKIHDGDRAIENLLANAAGDDVAASTIDQLAIDLTDLRRARESALAELRGELSEFEERD